jgi:DNA-binding MarR family transcriptional regulator
VKLREPHYQLLALLCDEDRLSVSMATMLMRVSPSTTERLVHLLEEGGYAQRTVARHNHRIREISPTTRGRRLNANRRKRGHHA